MVQSNLVERFDTAVVSLMSADVARACVRQINDHMNSARKLLLDLYEQRGWQALGYASWRECVVNEFDKAKTTLYQELEAAQIERRISANGGIGIIPERQLRPLAALTPMEQPMAWQEAQERSDGKPTARIVEEVVKEMLAPRPIQPVESPENDTLDPPMEEAQVADIQKATRINVGMFTSATPEWYTPRHVVDRVLKMFGEIDLDPCSNAKGAAANVPANDHYTQADDGLAQPWQGRVYMNPPYGDEIGQWTARLIKAYEAREIDEAIALLPARTDTAWFRPLMAHRCCFVHGRLKFSGAENSAPFPSVIVYLGPDRDSFLDHFSDIGTILERAA